MEFDEVLAIEVQEISRIEQEMEKVREHMSDKEKSNLNLGLSAQVDCLASDYECIQQNMMLVCQSDEVKDRLKRSLLQVLKASHERLAEFLKNEPENCFAEVIGYTVSKLAGVMYDAETDREKTNVRTEKSDEQGEQDQAVSQKEQADSDAQDKRQVMEVQESE